MKILCPTGNSRPGAKELAVHEGILIVLGNVPAQHYQPVRLELMREGVFPRVMRIDESYVLNTHFCTLHAAYAENPDKLSAQEQAFVERNPMREQSPTEAEELDYIRTFWGVEAGLVRGVMFSEPMWVHPDSLMDDWEEYFPNVVVRRVVHEDGWVEVV